MFEPARDGERKFTRWRDVRIAGAYGSDALSPLAYLAAKTDRIRLGTGIIQLAARTPANTAMTIATIDALAGGNRVMCGIGVSGPQIVEGWYGQPWGKPYYRIKDYVSIVKRILRRMALRETRSPNPLSGTMLW